MKYLEKKMKNKFLTLILLLFLFSSCSGLGVKRSDKSDEFLIQKKNPLSLPPNFGELPNPTDEENEIANNNEDEIMKILNKSDSSNDNSETSRIESLILEEINKE